MGVTTATEGRVYVFWDDERDLFKVGFTTREVEDRRRQVSYAAGVELETIAFWRGARGEEKALHEKIAAWRKHGEWFERNQPLIDWVLRDDFADIEYEL